MSVMTFVPSYCFFILPRTFIISFSFSNVSPSVSILNSRLLMFLLSIIGSSNVTGLPARPSLLYQLLLLRLELMDLLFKRLDLGLDLFFRMFRVLDGFCEIIPLVLRILCLSYARMYVRAYLPFFPEQLLFLAVQSNQIISQFSYL